MRRALVYSSWKTEELPYLPPLFSHAIFLSSDGIYLLSGATTQSTAPSKQEKTPFLPDLDRNYNIILNNEIFYHSTSGTQKCFNTKLKYPPLPYSPPAYPSKGISFFGGFKQDSKPFIISFFPSVNEKAVSADYKTGKAKIPHRFQHSSIQYSDEIIIFGGRGSNGQPTNDVYAYSPSLLLHLLLSSFHYHLCFRG